MSQLFEPAAKQTVAKALPRTPALVLAAVVALGILADRDSNLSLDGWLILASLAAAGWVCGLRWSHKSFSVAFLLLGWFSLAAAWHHWCWSCRAADNIANSATDEMQLVRLIGKVVQTPWIVRQPENARASWQNPDRTIIVVECRSLVGRGVPSLAVSGIARVSVDGEVANVTIGDVVEVIGEMSLPAEPSNPGEFDRRSFLRTQGIFVLLRSNHVDCIQVLQRERTIRDWLLVMRGAIRKRAEDLIAKHLGPDTSPVAQAMLLGTRAQIDDETRRAFRESGMLHILAISGMNVGLLWSWLWTLSRLAGRSAATSLAIVLIALPIYALVTDANPPIVRATVVAVIVAYGRLIGRDGSIANSLALAGLAVLAWNPSDLFNTGAQLSFLAVFAIIHTMNWLTLVRQEALALVEDAPLYDSFIKRKLVWCQRAIGDAILVGLAVWILTSPLLASEFHLISPVGTLLTVALIFPVTVMFWIGYSFLLLGLVSSSAFGWLGSLFDVILRTFLWSVRAGASWDLGHVYVPAPPVWWIVGFYGLTLTPILLLRGRFSGSGISVRAGLIWMVLGLAWGIQRPPHPGVTCTFISVGHGLSLLIECPNGRTVLYDAGSMGAGDSVARVISQTTWVTGRSHVDAVVLSHADGDHCNALPELARIVSPSEVFVHSSFLDWKQPAVAAAIEQSASAGAQVRLISEGQSLLLDPKVTLRVLHPPREFRSPLDNPNSLVVCLEYAGRRILLTGDLELEGLERLLKTPPIDADILLSPHHGSVKANPPDLARWATPEYVIVSTSDAIVAERLATRYGPESQIITTATYGAIRCRISPDGNLTVEPFKQKRTSK